MKPKGLNRIAKIGEVHLCLREENFKSEDNFITNRKFTSCCNIKILNRLWEEIYVIFSELGHES